MVISSSLLSEECLSKVFMHSSRVLHTIVEDRVKTDEHMNASVSAAGVR